MRTITSSVVLSIGLMPCAAVAAPLRCDWIPGVADAALRRDGLTGISIALPADASASKELTVEGRTARWRFPGHTVVLSNALGSRASPADAWCVFERGPLQIAVAEERTADAHHVVARWNDETTHELAWVLSVSGADRDAAIAAAAPVFASIMSIDDPARLSLRATGEDEDGPYASIENEIGVRTLRVGDPVTRRFGTIVAIERCAVRYGELFPDGRGDWAQREGTLALVGCDE